VNIILYVSGYLPIIKRSGMMFTR